MKKLTILLFSILISFNSYAEYSYPVGSDKHYYAMTIGGIGTYGSQCEKTSDFYFGLKVLQMIVINLGWNVTEQAEQIMVVLEVAKTDEFRQGANRMYREGCDKYRQRLQPAVNELKESIK